MRQYRLRSRYKVFLLLLLVWMAVIFFMSSRDGEESSAMSNAVLRWVQGGIALFFPGSTLDQRIFIVRKTAHVLEYLILEILMFFTVREWIRAKNKPVESRAFYIRLFLQPVIYAVLYAVTDEFHQRFVAERAGRVQDVGIDSIGVLLGFLISWLILNISYRCCLKRNTLG